MDVKMQWWLHFGEKLLVFGNPNSTHFSARILHFLAYFLVYGCLGARGILGYFISIYYPHDLVEMMVISYMATTGLVFNYQWQYLKWGLQELRDPSAQLDVASSYSAQAIPNCAEAILKEQFISFLREFQFFFVIMSPTIISFFVGGLIDKTMEYVSTGQIESVYVMHRFPFPMWAQIILTMVDVVGFIMMYAQLTSMFITLGIHTKYIIAQCRVLNEALNSECEKLADISSYIKDHVHVIRKAKLLMKVMSTYTSACFVNMYVALASQLLFLASGEATESTFVSVAMDLSSVVVLVVHQCWLSTEITSALESINPYQTRWNEKNKSYNIHVALMTQMAQKRYVPTIWFDSVKIQMNTMIKVFQDSYSIYVLLSILQTKKSFKTNVE